MRTELHEHLQQELGDAYDVERELGGGSMSRVFVVRERSLDRLVVTKVLPPEHVSGVSATRFQREILLTANLQHPHILPVLSAGGRGDLLYYITPYVEGESLRHRMLFEGRFAIADAVGILREVSDALAYAHERGVIHRDVKPENILLSGGHAVLADFGIARAIQQATSTDRITGAGPGVGTLGYQAPEQLANDPTTDARADVYALGVIGYEMLAGQPPFVGATRHALAVALLSAQPTPLQQLRPDVPRVIAATIARALAKAPEDRFPTAAEFRDALLASTHGASTEARQRRRRLRRVIWALTVGGFVAAAALGRWVEQRASAAPAHHTLAVLPFKNLGRPEDAYFADGITEELTSRFASIAGLGVISRTSADQYRDATKPLRQIARELGADYVLEGSVRWERTSGGRGRVRVTPQLIRVSDDSHLWAERYDAELSDVFEVQSRIAARVVGTLAVTLAGAERRRLDARPTANLAAYNSYIRGEQLLLRDNANPASLAQATTLLTTATQQDPRYALAFAKLSQAHFVFYMSFVDHTPQRMAAAQVTADSALSLDPSLPEGHLALAEVLEERGDTGRAMAEYALAERGRPNDSRILSQTARVLASRGRWPEALVRVKRAADLDPRSIDVNTSAAEATSIGRDYDAADRYAARAIAIDSTAIQPYVLMARNALLRGDLPRARALARGIVLRFGAEPAAAAAGFDNLLGVVAPTELAMLAGVAPAAFGGNRVLYLFWRAELFDGWRPELARIHADSLLREAEPLMRAQPNDFRLQSASGWLNAVAGHRELALQQVRRGLALMPRSADAVRWIDASVFAAKTFTRLGELDAAMEQLEELVRAPSGISVPVLRTDPAWAPLHAEPRFQRLLARGA